MGLLRFRPQILSPEATIPYFEVFQIDLGQESGAQEKPHKESKGPLHKELRALTLDVGVPLLLSFPGEEPPHMKNIFKAGP